MIYEISKNLSAVQYAEHCNPAIVLPNYGCSASESELPNPNPNRLATHSATFCKLQLGSRPIGQSQAAVSSEV